jgi:hypothetical protein
VGGVDGLQVPNAVSASPDGKNVYAASGLNDAVAMFAVLRAAPYAGVRAAWRLGLGGRTAGR